MPRYSPSTISHPESLSQRDLVQYLQGELKKIGAVIQLLSEGRQDILNVTPDRPREGQLVYADGTNFDTSGVGGAPTFFDGTDWRTIPGFAPAGYALLPNGGAIWVSATNNAVYYVNYNPATAQSIDSTRASWAISLGASGDNFKVFRAPPTAGTPAFATLLTVGSTGLLTILGQLKFPSSQNASADANTLDDYKEAPWTPTDASGAGLALTVNSAVYTKIGRIVIARCHVTYPVTANTASAVIGGLPYAAAGLGSAPLFSTGTGAGIAAQIFGSTLQPVTNSGGGIQNSKFSGAFVITTAIYDTA